MYLGAEGILKERISLDWEDEVMSEYYETVQKGNRFILHEYAAQHPAAAARAVHWTFDHCLRILFNTAPAATVSASEIHTDGVAARCEAGLIGHVQSYMGIVEPQMRKTEHLHKLIQVLGFTHPRVLLKVVTLLIYLDNSGVLWLVYRSLVKKRVLHILTHVMV